MKRLTEAEVDERLMGRGIERVGAFVNLNTRIKWKCTTCDHVWDNTPDRVIGKKQIGCPKCSNRVKLTDEIVDSRLPESIVRLSPIKGTHSRVRWQCTTCTHEWVTTPSNILNRGSGCMMCNNGILTNVTVDNRLEGRSIERLEDVKGTHVRMRWRCVSCSNEWSTSPASILNEGSGCPKCARLVSKGEVSWLDSLGVPNDALHRQVILSVAGRKYKVDGYDPETNTVYEFWGDYWHGNPNKHNPRDVHPITKKTFGQLYEDTQRKRLAITNAGYKLVEIWESDWRVVTSTYNGVR